MLGFAQVLRLKAYRFLSAEMPGPLQGDEELLNLVELDGVSGKARHVMCQTIRRGVRVDNVVPPRHDANGLCGICFADGHHYIHIIAFHGKKVSK
jgi:hypothetical protein